MKTTRFRRIALAALAVAGLTAVAAPAASASTLSISTKTTVAPYYNQSALHAPSRSVYEGLGPVMLKVRHTIKCTRGDYHRARPGYPPSCQWNSGLKSGSARVVGGQGLGGDVYAVAAGGWPSGSTYHHGYMDQGQTRVDEWAIIVRNDDLRELDEQFTMNVRSLNRTFTIIDDDSRR